MLLVVEWYFNDLQHNLQMTVTFSGCNFPVSRWKSESYAFHLCVCSRAAFHHLVSIQCRTSRRTTLTLICVVARQKLNVILEFER